VSEQIEAAWKLDGISPRAYQHPADRAAGAALAKVPYLDQVVRRLVALGYERALRAATLGAAVRLGDSQLPHIWVLHRQVFNALDMERAPDLYLTQFPLANAAAIGTDKPIVVLNSELVRILDDDGRRVVLAHEAAHVHSDHVLYQTALLILLRLGSSARLPVLAGLPLFAIQLALLEWWRAAELSCDRAAALVTRDPQAVCRSLMTIAAGEEAENLSLDAFIAQGMEYSEGGSGLERMTKLMQDMRLTHPMPVRRVKMLLDWVREGEYDRMVRGDYLRAGEEPSASEEAGEAGAFYGERIGGAFAAAGSSIADVGEQLGDWLKRTRDRAGAASGGSSDAGDGSGSSGSSGGDAHEFGGSD
jgi:Zn-dependent protease with chaperone function